MTWPRNLGAPLPDVAAMTGPRLDGSGQVAIAGYAHSPITRHIDEPLGTLAIKTTPRPSPMPG